MVSTLFSDLGFSFKKEEINGDVLWEFQVNKYKNKQNLIKVN